MTDKVLKDTLNERGEKNNVTRQLQPLTTNLLVLTEVTFSQLLLQSGSLKAHFKAVATLLLCYRSSYVFGEG